MEPGVAEFKAEVLYDAVEKLCVALEPLLGSSAIKDSLSSETPSYSFRKRWLWKRIETAKIILFAGFTSDSGSCYFFDVYLSKKDFDNIDVEDIYQKLRKMLQVWNSLWGSIDLEFHEYDRGGKFRQLLYQKTLFNGIL